MTMRSHTSGCKKRMLCVIMLLREMLIKITTRLIILHVPLKAVDCSRKYAYEVHTYGAVKETQDDDMEGHEMGWDSGSRTQVSWRKNNHYTMKRACDLEEH